MTPQGEHHLRSCLLGRFNLSNVLAAVGALLGLEYALDFIGVFAPHLERRAVSRALASGGTGTSQWPGVPHWRERRVPVKLVEPLVEAQ